MHANDLNERVSETLKAFETMAPIEPSGHWQDHVMSGIEAARLKPATSVNPAGITTLVLFFVLLNMGYFLSAYFRNTTTSQDNHKDDLQTISTELLINPSSITN